MFWGMHWRGAVVDLGIGLPGVVRPPDNTEAADGWWKSMEDAVKGEVIKVRGSFSFASC